MLKPVRRYYSREPARDGVGSLPAEGRRIEEDEKEERIDLHVELEVACTDFWPRYYVIPNTVYDASFPVHVTAVHTLLLPRYFAIKRTLSPT